MGNHTQVQYSSLVFWNYGPATREMERCVRGKTDAFGHVGSEVLVGCQADVQQAHGIRDNGLGESLIEIDIGGGKSYI